MSRITDIAFISPHSDPLGRIGDPDCGGQCIVEKALMEHLTRLNPDIRVDCYTRHYNPKPRLDVINERARVIRIPCGGPYFIRKEDLYERLPEFAENAAQWAAENGRTYHMLHGHYADGGEAARLLAERWKRPFVFTAHSLGKIKQLTLPDDTVYRYSVRIPIEEGVIRHAACVFALNRTEIGYYRDYYNAPEDRLRIVPNGVDTGVFNPKNAGETSSDPRRPSILTTGRLDARKGFGMLARTVERVSRELKSYDIYPQYYFPQGQKPVSEPEQAVLNEIQRAIPPTWRGQVHFFPRLGFKALTEWYAKSDVFVCPSTYEPFGMVIIEAMASGTPVIATRFGGPSDILEDGEDGFLVDPSDTDILSRRLIQLLTRQDLYQQFRERGLDKVRQCYAWPAVARQVLDQYGECAQ